MALSRLDTAKKFTQDTHFVYAVYSYQGTYLDRVNNFEVYVLPADVPESPTDQQIRDAADAKALVTYNDWMAAVDFEGAPPTETILADQGDTLT